MAVAERPVAEAIHARWNQLYSDYYQLALGLAQKRVRNHSDAEDAVQQTFMGVYELLAADKAVDNWEAMITTIATRAVSKERQAGERVQDLTAEIQVDQEAERDAAERREAFEAGFRALSQAEQQAVYYTLVEGLSSAEVGERLGTSAESARHLLSRGRAALVLDMVSRNESGQRSTDDRPLGDICRYLAHRMSDEERREFVSHLKSCTRCRITVQRVREFRGFVLLLLPAGLVSLYGDHLYAQIQAQKAGSTAQTRRRIDMRLVAAGLLLALLTGGVVIVTRKPAPSSPGSPVLAAAPGCPTGKIGGFAYIDGGNVIYRSSPSAPPQQISSSGRADALSWTPDGTTLIYKDERRRGPVAGTLYAVRPGSAPFWSFGTAVDSFAISPDGKQIAALVEHDDASGNWVGWTLHIGAIGGGSAIERYMATPVPDQWQEPVGADPFAESNFGPAPGLYFGVFWFGHTLYIADGEVIASFDENANPLSAGWASPTQTFQSLVSALSEPRGSALHYAAHDGPVTATCGSSTKPVVAAPAFTEDTSRTLTLTGDPGNPRAALAVEVLQGPSSGDIYLVTADGGTVGLTSDGSAYLPSWQP